MLPLPLKVAFKVVFMIGMLLALATIAMIIAWAVYKYAKKDDKKAEQFKKAMLGLGIPAAVGVVIFGPLSRM
jgi:hypothetical protein